MTANYCSNCGEPLKENAVVCSNCGRPVPEQERTQEKADTNQSYTEETVKAEKVYEAPRSEPVKTKSAFFALILSFFIPGLGQVYNGHFWRGVFFMFAVPIGTLFLIIPGIVIWAWGLYDAYTESEAVNRGEKPFIEPTVWQIIGFLLMPILLVLAFAFLFTFIMVPLAVISYI